MADSNTDTVQFKSPTTGKVQAVPTEHWNEALKLGYMPTTHKVMYSPKGERGMVPNAELHDYVKQGYQTSLPTRFERERAGGTVGAALKSMIPPDPTGGAPILSKKFWFGKPSFEPTAPGTAFSALTRPLPKAQGQEGTNLPTGSDALYRAASLVAPLAGVSPESMEEASERGATSEVATQAGIPTAAALVAPLAAKYGPTALEAASKAGKKLARGAVINAAGETRLPIKLAIGKGRADILSDVFKGPEKAAAAERADIIAERQKRASAYAEMNEDFAKRTKESDAAKVKAESEIAAERQKRAAAHAEMEEDFANRRQKAAKDLEKRLADAEDQRQKEITDWAKVDKASEADQAAFDKRMKAIEVERQKALADMEKLKDQHAKSLMQRGKEQQAMDAAHERRLSGIENERQKTLADQERFKEQHAEALNRRQGAKRPPLPPPPSPFAGMTSSAAPIGNAPLPPAPATIRMGTGIGAEGLKAGPPPPPEVPITKATPTVGSEIAARGKKSSILSRGTELYQLGEEPDRANPIHEKIINQLQTRSGAELRAMAKNGDRFAAFVLRNMPRP